MKGRLAVKNGKYYVVISYKDEQGYYKNKWIATGLDEKNNKRAANDMMREIVGQFERGELRSTPKQGLEKEDTTHENNPLFSDYLMEWLQIAKANIQISTFSNYNRRAKAIAAYFAEKKIRLKDLKPKDIQDYYTHLQKNGKTVQECHHMHTVIHRALQVAYRSDYIQTNPADKVERPKSPKYKAKFYTAEQMKTLFEKLKDDPYGYIYKLTAIYGLRRSEVLGMRWSAIDFERNTITLDHAVIQCEVDGKRRVVAKDKMKNQSSMRTLPILPAVKEMLLQLKQEQEERQERYGEYYNPKYLDYVCVDETGTLVRPDTLTTHFKSFLVRNNLPVIRLHELRHSCASILIASGVSMKAVQEWLGHSTFSTTADIYSHLNYSSKLNIAETLSGIFGGKPVLQTQDDFDVMATMQKIFYSSDMLDEPPKKSVKQTETVSEEADQLVDEESDIAEFKHVRDEMERLGFETLDEYFDYLDYIEQRQKRKSSSMQM